MSQSQKSDRTRRVVRTGLVLATTLFPLPLLAQTEAPAAPAVAAPAATPEPGLVQASMTATVPAPAVVAQAAVAAPAPEPTVTAAAPVAPEPEKPSPLEVNVWGRIGNEMTKKKGADAKTNTSANAEVDLLLNGRIHKYVGWTADFVATYGPGQNGHQQHRFDPRLDWQVRVRRCLQRLVRPHAGALRPFELQRSLVHGPVGVPGLLRSGRAPIGPKQGAFGRNDGATVWGQFGGGLLKYYVGAFDLTQKDALGNSQSPLFTSRVNLSLHQPGAGLLSLAAPTTAARTSSPSACRGSTRRTARWARR